MKALFNLSFVAVGLTSLVVGYSSSQALSTTNSLKSSNRESSNMMLARGGQFIKIDGSSTVFPISHEASQRFQNQNPDTSPIAISFSSTGSGFEKLCSGEIDLNGASRPINAEELESCQAKGIDFIEIPVALDAITVVVHPENTWANNITVEELKTIWEDSAEGKITSWNQVRDSWPNLPLDLYAPSIDSGTFDYFTETILGEPKASRADYAASSDDSVLVNQIINNTNALGYFGLSYYATNWRRLKPLAIDNGQGAVKPTVENVKNSQYKPLTRPLFIYVNANSVKSKPELKSFVEYYLQDVANWISFIGYVSLSKDLYNQASARFQEMRLGTMYQLDGQQNK